MKSVAKIKLSGLMNTRAVRKVFEVLQNGEKEHQVLFVGGCVRNALLNEKIADIDLATKLLPAKTMALLKKAGIKVIPKSVDHGTVMAVLDGQTFEITTLRRDIDTDGRHAVVAFTNDWVEDARRRDFTLNTLLADAKGNIYDPLGTGLKDLKRQKIIFVGDPAKRIQEDYLRILRFFRFHARYGKGAPDLGALKACAALAKGMKALSKERVTQELLKILSGPNTGKTITLINHHKILSGLISSKYEESYFNALKKLDKVDFEILGLLILSGFSKFGTISIENGLRLSGKQQKQIDIVFSYLSKFKNVTEIDLKILLYRTGHETAELVLISRLLLSRATPAKFQKWISVLRNMERPVLPLRGQDLLDRGMMPGPEIKKTLERFERLWIRNGFQA